MVEPTGRMLFWGAFPRTCRLPAWRKIAWKVVRLKPDRMRGGRGCRQSTSQWLPLHRGGSASLGVGTSEPSPLLLTEGGPEGAGCGGDPVRFIGLFGNAIGPTSVSPDGLPPSPQGEGFSLKPLPPTPNSRTLPPAPSVPPPSSEGGKGLPHSRRL